MQIIQLQHSHSRSSFLDKSSLLSPLLVSRDLGEALVQIITPETSADTSYKQTNKQTSTNTLILYIISLILDLILRVVCKYQPCHSLSIYTLEETVMSFRNLDVKQKRNIQEYFPLFATRSTSVPMNLERHGVWSQSLSSFLPIFPLTRGTILSIQLLLFLRDKLSLNTIWELSLHCKE